METKETPETERVNTGYVYLPDQMGGGKTRKTNNEPRIKESQNMNCKNKLIGVSLIFLMAFSSCQDKVESGDCPVGKGDHSLTFAVSTQAPQTWTKADGSRAASTPVTQDLEPVEMEGKLDGKTVYLTAEVTDGFPTDNQPMTRGTQVTEDNKTKDGIMDTFAISAYTATDGKPDFMYNVKTTKGSSENGITYWYPEEKFYWPGVRTLNFYAWYPHTANAEGLTVSGADATGAPTLHYIAPDDVKKQMDVMTAVATNQTEQEAIPLTFNHALAAVKFVAGADLPNCVVKSVKLYNLQYEGTYDIGTSTWTDVKSDKKDFTVSWGYNAVKGTEGSPITRENETLFMMPQSVEGKKVEVTFRKTDNTEFTVGAALTGTWEKGKTYTYRVSYNFVYLGVSNERFVAYVDKTDEMKEQIAFYVNFNSSDENATAKINFPTGGGLTVTPVSITPGSNIPVKVSWKGARGEDYNWLYATLAISMGEDEFGSPNVLKTLGIIRPNTEENELQDGTNIFEKDGAFWLYSLPETTSKPFRDGRSDGDIIELQNVSQSDWLAITPSSTYNKNAKYQAIYDNPSKGDIYLQTLSIPTENRFASLLACKEDMSKNIMYCVEQKALTADFGFKDCERNISREAEKWNIQLNGGRFKEDVTNLKARVVISSSVDDTQVSDLGRDLTYGEPVTIAVDKTTSTGVSATPYVKKRWDNQTETTANNGTRAVNVQVLDENSQTWMNIGGSGAMADWMTWGPSYVFANLGGTRYYAGSSGNAEISTLLKKVYEYSAVHVNHPLFGSMAHKWKNVNREYGGYKERSQSHSDPIYRFWANYKGSDYGVHGNRFTGGGFLTIAPAYNSYERYVNADGGNSTYYFARGYRVGNAGEYLKSGFFYIECSYGGVWGTTYGSEKESFWNNNKIYIWTVPIIYMTRPTDTNPVTGKSVNE